MKPPSAPAATPTAPSRSTGGPPASNSAASAKEPGGWQQYVDRYIACGEPQYLQRVGGEDAIHALALPVTLPAGQLTSALGVRTVTYQSGSKNLAIADEQLT